MDIVTERQAKIMVIVVALLLFICGASLVLYDFMYGEAVVTGAAVTDMPDDSIAPGVIPGADNLTNTTDTTFKGSPSDSSGDYQPLEYYGYTAPDVETRISGGGGRGGGLTGGGGGSTPVQVMANALPTVSNLALSTASGGNRTDENITGSWTVADSDGNPVYNVTNWKINGSSFTDLTMPFENNTANVSATTKDYSGNGYNGTMVGGLAWNATGGREGGAYYFSGLTSERIEFDSKVIPVGAKSLSAWVKTGGTGSHTIMSTAASTHDSGITLFVSSGNVRVLIPADIGGIYGMDMTGSEIVNDNEWHHILYTHDGTTGVNSAKIYVDGELDVQGTPIAVETLHQFNLEIGTYRVSSTRYAAFLGYIDDVRVYDRVLSVDQASILAARQPSLAADETSETDLVELCVTPNDGREDGVEQCSAQMTVLSSFAPPAQSNNYVAGLGTDLSSGYDAVSIQNVSGYVWHSNGNGVIRWNDVLNFSDSLIGNDNDLDDDVTFGASFVSVNSTGATAFVSKSANITFDGVDCGRCDAQNIVYASGSSYTTLGEIQAGGAVCALSGRCSDFSCAAGSCSFTVTGFTGYGFGANSNITVNDSAEISGSASVGEAVTYYAYYLNSTSGAFIDGGSCNVTDPDSTYPMNPDTGNGYYYYNKTGGFGINGTKNYQVVCNHADYSRVNASDFLEVVGSETYVDRSSSVVQVTVTVINESRWNSSAGGNDAGKGGNVTEMDLSSSASTNKWAGYYGEVSGELRLGNTDGDLMYNFGALNQNQVKSVFASTDQNFGFATLYAASTANVDSVYSWDTTDSDSATLTLDDDTATISTVTSVPVANLSASTVYQSGAFKDVAGSPSAFGELAYGVNINVDQTAFNGYTQVDYELIVPVNSVGGTQTYYFFMDIE